MEERRVRGEERNCDVTVSVTLIEWENLAVWPFIIGLIGLIGLIRLIKL